MKRQTYRQRVLAVFPFAKLDRTGAETYIVYNESPASDIEYFDLYATGISAQLAWKNAWNKIQTEMVKKLES